MKQSKIFKYLRDAAVVTMVQMCRSSDIIPLQKTSSCMHPALKFSIFSAVKFCTVFGKRRLIGSKFKERTKMPTYDKGCNASENY